MDRKIIQISSNADVNGILQIVALSEDSTIFAYQFRKGKYQWCKIPDIPQDKNDN